MVVLAASVGLVVLAKSDVVVVLGVLDQLVAMSVDLASLLSELWWEVCLMVEKLPLHSQQDPPHFEKIRFDFFLQ